MMREASSRVAGSPESKEAPVPRACAACTADAPAAGSGAALADGATEAVGGTCGGLACAPE
jgi:hypothetical protein